MHTFRHDCIGNALSNGISESPVRRWVWHIDPAIAALYTHVLNDIFRE